MRAFTLIELIIVIVLLGILGVMSTEIISQTYRNYVYQKDIADLQSRSKQLLDQLTTYLDRSIKPSIVHYNGARHDSIWGLGVTDANMSAGGGNYLEWIGKDTESLRGIWNGSRVYPGYSGLANVRDSSGTSIITTDCSLSYINQIQESITGWPDIVNMGRERAALYFVHADSNGTAEQRFWVNPSSLFNVTGFNNPVDGVIQLENAPFEIGERYYLTYSAYAIQLENDGTLYLYRNFRPWNGEVIDQIRIDPFILMENVASFEFWSESEDSLLRLKVCLEAENDSQTTFCKEAVVLR